MCYARRQRSSWARIKLSNNCILNSFELKISNSSFFLASFTFVWVYITLWRECISHFALLCTSLSVVQFSMTDFSPQLFVVFRSLSQRRLIIISHLFAFVKTFLKLFFQSFFRSLHAPSMSHSRLLPCSPLRSLKCLYILPHFFPFVNIFFSLFLGLCIITIFMSIIYIKTYERHQAIWSQSSFAFLLFILFSSAAWNLSANVR